MSFPAEDGTRKACLHCSCCRFVGEQKRKIEIDGRTTKDAYTLNSCHSSALIYVRYLPLLSISDVHKMSY